MAESRTKIQIEANKLDMEMFNLAEKLRAFGEDYAWKPEARCWIALSQELKGNRFHVRKYMHAKDRRDTA